MEIRASHLTFILGEYLIDKPDQHERFCALVLAIMQQDNPTQNFKRLNLETWSSDETVFFCAADINTKSTVADLQKIHFQDLQRLETPQQDFRPQSLFLFFNTNSNIDPEKSFVQDWVRELRERGWLPARSFGVLDWPYILIRLNDKPHLLKTILHYSSDPNALITKKIFSYWEAWIKSTASYSNQDIYQLILTTIELPRSLYDGEILIRIWEKRPDAEIANAPGEIFLAWIKSGRPLNSVLHSLQVWSCKDENINTPVFIEIFSELFRRGESIAPFTFSLNKWLTNNYTTQEAGLFFAAWIRDGLLTSAIEAEMASWILFHGMEPNAGTVFAELLAAGYNTGIAENKLLEWLNSDNGVLPEAGAVYYTWLKTGANAEKIVQRLNQWQQANPHHPDSYRIAQLTRGECQSTDKFYPDLPITLRSLNLTHARKFTDFATTFSIPADPKLGQWVVILGENGVGKTTLLRCLILALRNVEKRDIWPQYAFTDWENVNASDAAKPEIKVETNNKQFLTRIPAPGEVEQEPRIENNSVYPLFAYGCRRGSALGGALRAVEMGGGMEVATLFDEGAALVHAETWLKELDGDAAKSEQGKALFDSVITALKSMLMVENVFVKDMLVWVQEAGKQAVPFRYLSDAYLTTAGWFLDLLARWLHMARQENIAVNANFMAEMRGLVLIDEIDLHLHPRLQIDIIPRTRKLLPQMSFVVTTHNALTLLGAQPEEIRILREEAGVLTMTPGVEPPQLLTPAQILHSYFGIDGYRPSDIGRALKRYAFLADFSLRNDAEEAELMQLRATLDAANSLPDWEITPREILDVETSADAATGMAGESDDTPA